MKTKPAKSTGRSYLAKWRSQKAEQKYRRLDEALWLRDTNSQPEAIDVDTRFGLTRTYRWPGAGPSVLCIHGMGDTSIRWIPYAEKLASLDFYAVDIMGDVGRSQPNVGFTDAEDYATWLGETIDSLGLQAPCLVGESLGGYVALAHAIGSERVASVVGLDPVGIVDLQMARFMAWAFAAGAAHLAPGPVRRKLAQLLGQPLLLDRQAMQLYLTGQRGHPPKIPPLPVFTDDELASVTVPVHVLAGAKSAAFDARKMAARVNTNIGKGHATILPDVGHSLSMSRFNEAVDAIQSAVDDH